jgi:hypothetical protein
VCPRRKFFGAQSFGEVYTLRFKGMVCKKFKRVLGATGARCPHLAVVWLEVFQSQPIASGDTHVCMNAKPGNRGAARALERIEAVAVDLVPEGGDATSGIWSRGDSAPGGGGINRGQSRLVP